MLKWLFERWQDRASKFHKGQKAWVWKVAVQQAKAGEFRQWLETQAGQEMSALVYGYDLTNEAYSGAELMEIAKEVLL